MSDLDRLEQMFAKIRAETVWKMDGPMLWGYFFFDPSDEKLRPLAERLVADGYRLMSLELTDVGNSYRLHVERIEIHSPESLHERNSAFGELADEYGVESYDGWDVGRVAS